MMDTDAVIAFNRFGLGRRCGEALPGDPRAWLRGQIDMPDLAPAGVTSAQALEIVFNVAHLDKSAGIEKRQTPEFQAFRELERAEPAAFLAQAITTPYGFRERLVWFWYNHFTVSARGRPATACVGAFIREAIRPNVNGRFRDMLLAVMRHPAMLAYLDQMNSVGPDSAVGQRKNRGLNENLARECLELHTVTPAAGYTQTDVTNFAKVLTGWTYDQRPPARPFVYQAAAHEPGDQDVLGRSWPDGEQGGVMLLEFLADHPATQHHLAEKLVRHFVADDPAPADVARIATVFRDTGGDLHAVSLALIALPSAWQPLTKLRSPQEYVVAVMRAVGANPQFEPQLPNVLHNLGQPLFKAPFPIGWPDRAADWASPEAILQRVDFAYQFSGRVTDQEPADVAAHIMGPLLAEDTGREIRRAGSRRDGLTLLLASPEFQRR
jgi:uncharacterized protein (DUF1800 family)